MGTNLIRLAVSLQEEGIWTHRHQECPARRKDSCEGAGRKRPSASHGERTRKEANLPTP